MSGEQDERPNQGGRARRLASLAASLRDRFSPRLRRRLMLGLATALLVGAGVGTGVAINYSSMLDRIVNPSSTDVTEEQKDATASANDALARRVESEGVVLLKNDADDQGVPTLPLASTTKKVNVFGWASTDWLGGGSGSGGVKSTDTSFLEALEDYGVQYNTALSGMYESFQAARDYRYTLHCKPEESARLYEPSIQDHNYYSEQLLTDAEEFSDTAIVVIGRLAGESNDLPWVQYKRTTRAGEVDRDLTRKTLELSSEELELLEYVGATYDHVVVVLNTGNVMELGPIETIPGVDACLLAGYSGQDAAAAIPAVLWGDTNPSGRTTDTWAYDLSTAPSYANAGKQGVGAYTNADGLYPYDGTQCGNLGVPFAYDQVSYVDYAEGIYVGYRWYETADAEGCWADAANGYGTGYDGVVQYPFGFGLSYTSFSWEVVSAPRQGLRLSPESEVSFTVRVTNTGEVAGRDVVQLYASAPYHAGEVEKASVELADYAKTALLQPGESQEVTLRATVADLASYDCYDANASGFAGYELDAGDYTFTLRRDAHTVDAAEGSSVTCRLRSTVALKTDAVTGAEVSNRFTGDNAVDGVSLDGANAGQGITYLTRADFKGTFPHNGVEQRAMTEQVAAFNRYTDDDAETWGRRSVEDVRTDVFGSWRVERNGELTDLGRRLGVNYDDEQWGQLLSQLSVSEMERLVTDAYSGTASLESVGKPMTKDADGPSQIGGFTGFSVGTGFPCSWVLAQTWNDELAHDVGRAIGQQAAQLGYSGWYAPAANLHRSPVGGRNYEYYAEDDLLSGRMCGNTVAGAKEAGAFCYVKHLIANDGEAHIYRDSVYTWMTEQTLRELYLRPFQMLVEQYGGTGIMTSYNRLGAVWAGGSTALLTDVLRGEWGFEGAVITDYSDHPAYMNGDQMLRAGGDLWMAGTELMGDTSLPVYKRELQRVAKDVLYMYLNARVTNEAYVAQTGDSSLLKPKITGSVPLWKIGIAALDVVAVGLFALALRSAVRSRRVEAWRAEFESEG